jgi:hypothetical protein
MLGLEVTLTMSFRHDILQSLGILDMDASFTHLLLGYHPAFVSSKQELKLNIIFQNILNQ